MIFCPKNFVGNPNFYSDVLNILTKNYLLPTGSTGSLFVPNPSNIIDTRYKDMKRDYCNTGIPLEQLYPLSSLNPFGISPNVYKVGHDLPIWYTPYDEPIEEEETIICPKCDETEECTFTHERLKGKRIMIVGLEPMRKNPCPGYISLSTPWGLHNRDYREGKKAINAGPSRTAKWMYIYIKALLRNGAYVYLTDAYKLFFTNNISSTTPGHITPAQINLFTQIIDEEIELFKPYRIYALGLNNATRLMAILSKHHVVWLNHINTRGWTDAQRCKYYENTIKNTI